MFILHLLCHGAHVKTRELWELASSFYLVLEIELRSSGLTAIAFTYWAILLVLSSELLRINRNDLQLKWQLDLKGGWFFKTIFLLIICEFHTVYFDCIYLPNALQIHYQLPTRPTLCLFILKIHWVQCAPPKLLYIEPPSGAWLTYQGAIPWIKMNSVSQQLSVASSFSARGVPLCQPLPSCWDFIRLEFV